MSNAIVRCDTCGTMVELVRQQRGELTLTCDCPEMRAIKVSQKLPEGWSE